MLLYTKTKLDIGVMVLRVLAGIEVLAVMVQNLNIEI